MTVALRIKFSRNPGCMPKMSTHVLSISRNHKTRFLMKIFAECCGSTVLTAAYLLLAVKSLYPAQKLVSVSMELNHYRSPWVLDSDKCECCHHSFIVYISGGRPMTL